MRFKIAIGLLAAVAIGLPVVNSSALGGAVTPEPAPSTPSPGVPTSSAFRDAAGGGGLKPCTDTTANFDAYSAGATFDGLRRANGQRICKAPDATAIRLGAPALRDNSLTFTYGTCKIPDEPEASCPYPLAIQNFPACERNLSLYRRFPSPTGDIYPYVQTKVRGVPAAVFDDGQRVEVYIGDATVVIWGQSATRVAAAAKSLQGIHRGQAISSAQELPLPEPGAIEGRLAC